MRSTTWGTVPRVSTGSNVKVTGRLSCTPGRPGTRRSMACRAYHHGLASLAVAEPTYVCAERELEPVVAAGDTAAMRVSFDSSRGSETLTQRLLRFGPGRSAPHGPGEREEALFIVEGSGTLLLDGSAHAVEP